MTTAEKIALAKSNNYFTLFKEGLFYKCYNEDAMVFVQRLRAYKVSTKFIKIVGDTVYSIGFPVGEVEKVSIKPTDFNQFTARFTAMLGFLARKRGEVKLVNHSKSVQ
uniref:hypothetical protein n=1 Tax=Algoriphagus sp. TaxID=1872435 RepID=UPI004047298C